MQVLGQTRRTGPGANSETDPEWGNVVLRFSVGDGYDVTTPVYLSVDAAGTVSTYVWCADLRDVQLMPNDVPALAWARHS